MIFLIFLSLACLSVFSSVSVWAVNIGPVLPVASEAGNQQNPAVVALPDQGLWFVVWEDWSRPGDVDLKGAFLKLKAVNFSREECLPPRVWYNGSCYEGLESCGEFVVAGGPGHQLSPATAYDQDHQRLVVVWQDSEWPYLWYRFLAPPRHCGDQPEMFAIQKIPYEPALDCISCQLTCVCVKEITYQEACTESYNYWNPCDGRCYDWILTGVDSREDCENRGDAWCQTDPQQPGQCYVNPLSYQAACRSWKLVWSPEEQTCYVKEDPLERIEHLCNVQWYFSRDEVRYPSSEECSIDLCQNFCQQEFGAGSFATTDDSSALASPLPWEDLEGRTGPQVVYNPHDQAFWFAWIERHQGGNRIRDIIENPSTKQTKLFDNSYGQGLLPAFGKLDVSQVRNWGDTDDKWEMVAGFRYPLDKPIVGKKVLEDKEDLSRVYKFFSEIDQIVLAPNLREGGVFIFLSGKRTLVRYYWTFEEHCEDWKDSTIVDRVNYCSDLLLSSLRLGKQIFGLSDSFAVSPQEALVLSINGKKTPFEEYPAYAPTAAYDPVTNRFLVAWEDARDSGDNTKIYAQIIDAFTGGLYHQNFPLSTEEELGDLWPLVRETHPAACYDPVNQRFFVAWQDNRAGAVSVENMDIFGQKINPDGSLSGNNFLVSATEGGKPAAGNQLAPVIAYNETNLVYLAVWKDARNYQETGSDIYAQAFTVDQPQLTVLDGEGNPLHPAVLDFGTIYVGERVSQSFYLKNTGDALLRLCELSALSPPFSYLLAVQALIDGDEGTCLSLQPGMQVEIIVEFAPTLEGTFADTIQIISDAGEKTLLLQGGVRPVISVNQSDFDFGSVLVGNSRSIPFTLVNQIDEDVSVGQVLGLKAPFALEGIGPGTIIPAGGSVKGNLLFAPMEPGNFSDTVTITFSKGGDITFSLNGTGEESPVSFSPPRLDFGNIKAGARKDLSFVIHNESEQTLTLISVENPKAPFYLGEFSLPVDIPPNGSFSIPVSFIPGEKGDYRDEMLLNFQWGSESFEIRYYLEGQALGLPACVFNGIPDKKMLFEGQNPIWFTLVTGEDLILTRLQEPSILQLEPLKNSEGLYLFAVYPPKDLIPYTYRDRFSLGFAEAHRPASFETLLNFAGPPPGWDGCVPQLGLTINNKRAILLHPQSLPPSISLSLSISWPCVSQQIQTGNVSLKVVSPYGNIYYYDLDQGFVPWLKKYQINSPFNFSYSIDIPLPSNLPKGLWLFELWFEKEDKKFYTQAGVILTDDNFLKDICSDIGEIIDLME